MSDEEFSGDVFEGAAFPLIDGSEDTPLKHQVGGDHYRSMALQPVQFILANDLGFLEGCVVKRVSRHDRPGGKGVEDLRKAIHELELLIHHLENSND